MTKRIVLLGLLFLTGCVTEAKKGYFYVASTSLGYRVACDNYGNDTEYMTNSLSLVEATRVANDLNKALPAVDMVNDSLQ